VIFSPLIQLARNLLLWLIDLLPVVSLPAAWVEAVDLSWLPAALAWVNALVPLWVLAVMLTMFTALYALDVGWGLLTGAWRFLLRNGW
jgi:hypothetical protein